jgi:hypothetical protein
VQVLLLKLWISHSNYLSLHRRYEELGCLNDQLLSLSFHPSKKAISYLQCATIFKSVALRGEPDMGASVRRRKSAIAFLMASEARICDPECQAWYWMTLSDLLASEGAYDDAHVCLTRSNAIPHSDYVRGTEGESGLITAYNLANIGKPREALALLDSRGLLQGDFSPQTKLRALLYRARAMIRIDDITGALGVLNQLYHQIEETGIDIMRPSVDALFFQLARF